MSFSRCWRYHFSSPVFDVDGERGVRVETRVDHALLLGQEAAHFRDPRIGLAGAIEHDVLLWIIAA